MLLFEGFNEILDSNFNQKGSGAEEYSTAKEYGITCFWWDDGGAMDIISRMIYRITVSETVSAKMNAVNEG